MSLSTSSSRSSASLLMPSVSSRNFPISGCLLCERQLTEALQNGQSLTLEKKQWNHYDKFICICLLIIHCISAGKCFSPGGGGGTRYILWWEGAGRPLIPHTTHTLPLFKINIADFPSLFKTEFRFLISCSRHLSCLRQKLINSIPCLRQKSRKTYPDWPHVPIKPF